MSRKDIIIVVLALLTVVSTAVSVYALMRSDKAVALADRPQVKIDTVSVKAHDVLIPDTVYFAGERVPVELFYVRERLERELLSNTYFHSNTMVMVKRVKRWFPVIEPILKEKGVPEDFKYMPIVESNLTNAVSPAGAVGFWQMLKSTARECNLEVNDDVDMRYDVEKSTEAACVFLNKAYARFGSWALAAAAYNAGSKRIAGFMKDQNVDSYYNLLMAEETERYLFRMIALKLIIEDPQRYGYVIDENLRYEELEYKTVTIRKSVKDWAAYAESQGISYKLLKYFNPWLRSNELHVPKGKTYEIKIPKKPYNKTASSSNER